MSHFQPAGQTLKLPDPFKRVRYSLGLVLGVDEFEQEQAYAIGRGRLQNQVLQGSGTVYGLNVTCEQQRVVVSPGLAIDAAGRLIRVRPAQWADLNEWLALDAHRQQLPPGERHSLWVVLHYAEAETDSVPLVGPPGASEAELHGPSRVTETFELKFALHPPAAPEEAAVKALGDLLARLEPRRGRGGLTPEQMAQRVRALADPRAVPGAGPLPVDPEQVEAVLDAALRVWVTEVRPALLGDPLQGAAADPGLLLARVDFSLDSQGQATAVTVTDAGRPCVLSARLLREWLLRLQGRPGGGSGEAPAPAAGALHPGDPAGGDLTGSYPNPVVSRLQGRAVAAADPTDQAVLTWNAARARWEPQPLAQAGRPPAAAHRQVAPFVTIVRIRPAAHPTYELWLHVPEVHDAFGLEVLGEPEGISDPAAPATALAVTGLQPRGGGRFWVTLGPEADHHTHLRFVFFPATMRLKASGISLAEYMAGAAVQWLGWDGQRTVTAFHYQEHPAYEVVAAGLVEPDGTVRGTNLEVRQVGIGVYRLLFPGYRRDGLYVVKGTPVVGSDDYKHTFEVVRMADDQGILVRVDGFQGAVAGRGFMVEITRVR